MLLTPLRTLLSHLLSCQNTSSIFESLYLSEFYILGHFSFCESYILYSRKENFCTFAQKNLLYFRVTFFYYFSRISSRFLTVLISSLYFSLGLAAPNNYDNYEDEQIWSRDNLVLLQ